MKTHEELSTMSDEELNEYLASEVEKIISLAPKNNVLKLRKTQARIDGIRKRVKNQKVRTEMIYDEMIKSLVELRDALNGVSNK